MKLSLNHIYRTIWSEALNARVAVSGITPSNVVARMECNEIREEWIAAFPDYTAFHPGYIFLRG